MRPAVRLEPISGGLFEEMFRAFIFDSLVHTGTFEECQRILRTHGEYVTRSSIYRGKEN